MRTTLDEQLAHRYLTAYDLLLATPEAEADRFCESSEGENDSLFMLCCKVEDGGENSCIQN
jgi:hypothetical protein